VTVRRLSSDEARRIAVRAQLLDADRPPDLTTVVDRLIHDRGRALELFGFEFLLEMYKPRAQRRWGFFALPVLHHDRLVGKVDATADPRISRLHVHAVHRDIPFTRGMTAAVDAELGALVEWLGLDGVRHA
jgi:uncharacterized protein YcaQ